jgi:hypothetical protein
MPRLRSIFALVLLAPACVWAGADSPWLALGDERDTKDVINSVTLGLDVIGTGTLILDFPCGEFRSSRQ